jgi:thiamine-phosphate pyrophosphorylase
MKLIVITAPTLLENEIEAISLLFRYGLKTLHVRKPDMNLKQTTKFIAAINPTLHHNIVLSDHYELIDTFNLKGIHLNNRNKNHTLILNNNINNLKNNRNISISNSSHSLEEIKNEQTCDYIFLSPIFNSISKTNYNSAFSEQELLKAKNDQIINNKIIALGGITTQNIPKAHKLGFGGTAILGSLWNDFAKTKNTKELITQFLKLKAISDNLN